MGKVLDREQDSLDQAPAFLDTEGEAAASADCFLSVVAEAEAGEVIAEAEEIAVNHNPKRYAEGIVEVETVPTFEIAVRNRKPHLIVQGE